MIEINNLKKTYSVKKRINMFHSVKENVEAVKDVSMRIDHGQIVGLLGINGAGKTTTIKMLTTLIEPTAGTYSFDGMDAIENPTAVKKQINMIAGGERMIYWRLTAFENLWYYGQLYGIEKTELKKRISSLLKMVGLEEKANVPVETFSKGMKQRLQIARGLINNPKYIFLDEPTIGLDAMITAELHDEIRKMANEQEKGILLTSHYLSEVEELCDYIYLLDDGKVVIEGTKKELTDFVFTKKQFVFSVKGMDEKLISNLNAEIKKIDTDCDIDFSGNQAVITTKLDQAGFLAEYALKENLIIKELYEREPSLEQAILAFSNRIREEQTDEKILKSNVG